MERLKHVTADVLSGVSPPQETELPNAAIFAETRADAARLMALVEGYYKVTEPASPIPLLLSRAQSSVSRDFMTILNEILPRETSQ
ncbi:MAG: hypothetical protein EON58_19305 [Alphaproteobacteria bacterium]|nr:MAG: hypothetical protein EON58_19305 [Alphaproteobacteria bacterium]